MPSYSLASNNCWQVFWEDTVDNVGEEGARWRTLHRGIVTEVLLEGGVIESHLQKHLDTDLAPARKFDSFNFMQFECKLLTSEQLLDELPVDDAVRVEVKLLYSGW